MQGPVTATRDPASVSTSENIFLLCPSVVVSFGIVDVMRQGPYGGVRWAQTGTCSSLRGAVAVGLPVMCWAERCEGCFHPDGPCLMARAYGVRASCLDKRIGHERERLRSKASTSHPRAAENTPGRPFLPFGVRMERRFGPSLPHRGPGAVRQTYSTHGADTAKLSSPYRIPNRSRGGLIQEYRSGRSYSSARPTLSFHEFEKREGAGTLS